MKRRRCEPHARTSGCQSHSDASAHAADSVFGASSLTDLTARQPVVKGNEDRRGPVTNHLEVLAKLREHAEAGIQRATDLKLDMAAVAAVTAWLDMTGVTGYYASQRDTAAQALLDARGSARKLAVDIDRALAQMRSIP